MRERYEIETVEQLRAIADVLRIRIIDILEKRAMTVTQLGEQLGLAPAKVHYHVRELERVGLLELVETREKGGILEKYYQPIAHEISVNKALLTVPSSEALAALQELFEQISGAYLQTFRRLAAQPESLLDAGMSLGMSHIYVTIEELHRLSDQFGEMLKPFEQQRGIEGEKEIAVSVLTYPPDMADQEQQNEAPAAQISRVWTIGATSYSRKELLQVRSEGKRLRINVIGLCHFASDISASLVEETVESFKLTGKLTASPEVKGVLKHKEV
ncbi:MAG: helix-turn-helix domain-containing protein [Ktedonobacteraceae bacterium]